jgi:aspartyl aminopeptidase
MNQPQAVLDRLLRFIDDSPSPFHAAASATSMLTTGGFNEDAADGAWDVGQPTVIRRGGSVVAFRCAPSVDPDRLQFRLVGAHTDSPNLRIKPQPDTGAAGYQQLGVEVYGGVLLNSWLDRDLGLSGRVAVSDDDGERVELMRIDRPLLRVAQLAIHLDREVNDGLKLDRQTQLAPIWGLGATEEGGFQRFLGDELSVDAGSITAWDVMAHDLTPSALLGRNSEFYAAPRIDNLASCHAALEALTGLDEPAPDSVAVVVLFDHEEIGSDSSTGAGSPILAHSLERIAVALGADRHQFLRSLERSWCVSADGAHAVHPNYLDRHEPNHQVALNAGPVIKLNANVRYASDAATSMRFQAACTAAGVPVQQYSHRTNLACGSTIGPITAAQLGMGVVDVGSAQLSMHSAREMGGSDDPGYLTAALGAFLAGA